MLTFVNSVPRTPDISGRLSNGGMDVYEIRRRNLDVLKAEADTFAAIGDAMRRAKADDPTAAGKDYANVLSQIKGGKNMGGKMARDLEVAMSKPRGWMDIPQFQAIDEAMEAKEAGQIVMSLEPEVRAAAMTMLRNLGAKGPKGASNPFGDLPKGGRRRRSSGTQ